MFIVYEVDNASMVVAEYPLFTEDGVELFMAHTNIQVNKEWLKEERFTDHLVAQLEDSSNEYVSYMIIPVTVH